MSTGTHPLALAGALLKPGVEPAVAVRKVNHYFGEGETRNQVLFENDLTISPGEIVIMTGPSGSGKTTLLTLISGLRTVQEGDIRVLGQELRDRSPEELMMVRRGIGFIFQAHNLFDSLTAYQNVRMALELHDGVSGSTADARIKELLTELELGHRIRHKPHQLSGGQRQRVAIARALANRPKLVMADEPTAALDEKNGRTVVTILQRMAETGTTSVIVTHDNRILDVADRIVNMVGGRITSNVLVKEAAAVCEFLSKSSVFRGLPAAALAGVAEKMRRVVYEAGRAIVTKGETGDRFYLIRRGTVDVLRDEGLDPVTLKEGEFFGEQALITGKPRNATVVARDEVETYFLNAADFRAAVEASPSFKEQLYKVFFQRQ